MKLFKSCCAILILAFSFHAQAIDVVFVASSAETYSQPHDVVLSPDERYLFVADVGNDRVAVLDSQTLIEVAAIGAAELSAPHDVAFDAGGRLLVADTGNDRIIVYALEGTRATVVQVFGSGLRSPEGVSAHPSGRIYATGAHSNNIVAFEDGKPVQTVGGLSAPHDVVVASDGTLWLADAGSDRIIRFTPSLEQVEVLSGPDYRFNGPRYLDLDDAQRLWVADKYGHAVKIIAHGGELIGMVGNERAGKGPGLLNTPEGVEVRGRDVWIADTSNNRIVRYRLSGE